MKHHNMLQHTATHCNTLQHTGSHCNTFQKYRYMELPLLQQYQGYTRNDCNTDVTAYSDVSYYNNYILP